MVCVMFFWLIFIKKVFIIKVKLKDNSFASNLERVELLCHWNLREFILHILFNICTTSAEKTGNGVK